MDDLIARIDAVLGDDDPFSWADAATWHAAEAHGEPPPIYRTYREMIETVMAYGESALPDLGT